MDAQAEQVAAVVDLLEDVFGADLVAAYLFGSAVAGGLKPDSDLDVFAVVGRRSAEAEKRRLVEGLRPLSDRNLRPHGWKPIDLSVVALPDVKPWRYPPRTDFQHGEWLRKQFDAGDLEPYEALNPDLAVQIAHLGKSHVTLRGLPVGDVLDDLPWADVERAMRDSVDGLLADAETDTANVLLTLARIWVSLSVRDFISKDAAADWVASRMSTEHRAAVQRARDVYLGDAEDRWDQIRAAAGEAISELVAGIERA